MPKAAYSKCLTANCEGDPNASGCAGGRCTRCYQRHRRGLPPRSFPAYLADGAQRLTLSVDVDPKLKRTVQRVAEREGSTVSEWIRRAILIRLG